MIFFWTARAFCNLFINIFTDIFESLDISTFIDNLQTWTLYILDIVSYVYYFLPVTYLTPLLFFIFSIVMTRILVAIARLVLEVVGAALNLF